MRLSFPPPSTWQDFEALCHDLWRREWDDPHAKLHGRSGQKQHGVDIFGRRGGAEGGWEAVQCKQKTFGQQLTEAMIRAEVKEAKGFGSPLQALVIATTAPRDKAVQGIVRGIDDTVDFRLSVESWDDLEKRLNDHRDIARKYYPPEHFGDAIPHNLRFLLLRRLFLGRDAVLRDLAGDPRSTAILQHPEAIYGLGGIGKTRLAVEYAWRFMDRYPGGVFFVSAETPEVLRAGLVALGAPRVLDVPEHGRAIDDVVVDAVLRRLRERGEWLMILDNVDDDGAAAAVESLLPQLIAGRVLITSRLSAWGHHIREQPLGVLAPAAARAYLLDATPRRHRAEDDEAQADTLVSLLDGLPLALEQAAAYIDRHRLGFATYLEEWEQEREQVMAWFDPRTTSYPRALAVTWQRTFDRLDPAARALLNLASFLAPEPIPEWLVTAEALAEPYAALTGDADPEATLDPRHALVQLADYCLIIWADGMFGVHRMVQEVVRSKIPKESKRDWIRWALEAVDAVAEERPSDVRTWPVWNRLRPHVEIIARRADQAEITDPTSRLMSDLGVLLQAKGLYKEAEYWKRRALEIDEVSHGSEHSNVAVLLNNLAVLLRVTDRLEEAEPLMRRALKIDEEAYGLDHPNVARNFNNLAQLLKAMDRLEEAEPLMRRALEIDEQVYGPDHPNVAIGLNNLGRLLQASGHLDKAEPLMRRALEIDEAFYGLDHPDVATNLNNLGLLLQASGRLDEAEPLMRRAVEILETSLGSDHPNTRRGQGNLASLLEELDER